MKASELIEALKEHDPELEILISEDEEGYDFSELADMSLENLIPVFENKNYTETNKKEYIVLWPWTVDITSKVCYYVI